MVHDPVCMAEIDEVEAGNLGLASELGTKRYFFCCDQCKEQFDRDPDAYMFNDLGEDMGQQSRPDDYTR